MFTLANLSIFSVLLPAIAGLLILKRLDTNSRWILLLVIIAALPQLSALAIPALKDYKTILYNLYILVDVAMFALLFIRNSRIKIVKIVIATIAGLEIAGFSWNFYLKGVGNGFSNEFVCLNSLFQVLWVLAYFYERYMSEEIGRIEKEPIFWFCLGILLYAPTTYFLFAYYKEVKFSPDPSISRLWGLHHVLNPALYLLFTFGICINLVRKPKPKNATR